MCGLWTPHGTDWPPVGTRNSRLHVREAGPVGTGWEAPDAPSRAVPAAGGAFPCRERRRLQGGRRVRSPGLLLLRDTSQRPAVGSPRTVGPAVMTGAEATGKFPLRGRSGRSYLSGLWQWDFLLLFPNRSS